MSPWRKFLQSRCFRFKRGWGSVWRGEVTIGLITNVWPSETYIVQGRVTMRMTHLSLPKDKPSSAHKLLNPLRSAKRALTYCLSVVTQKLCFRLDISCSRDTLSEECGYTWVIPATLRFGWFDHVTHQVWIFINSVLEDSHLLRCYDVSTGKYWRTFRRYILTSRPGLTFQKAWNFNSTAVSTSIIGTQFLPQERHTDCPLQRKRVSTF